MISTGVEGGASLIGLLRSSNMAPDFAVDVADHEIVAGVERAVLHQDGADGPRPRSSFASSTNPLAAASRSGFQFLESAVRQIISISRLRLVFCFAETSTNTVLPPPLSGTRPRSASCFLTRSGRAPGLSILLTATMMGNLRRRARGRWLRWSGA